MLGATLLVRSERALGMLTGLIEHQEIQAPDWLSSTLKPKVPAQREAGSDEICWVHSYFNVNYTHITTITMMVV